MQFILQEFYGSKTKFLQTIKSTVNCTMLGFDILQQATDGEDSTSVRCSDCRGMFRINIVLASLLEILTGGCSAQGHRTFAHLFQMLSIGEARCGWISRIESITINKKNEA